MHDSRFSTTATRVLVLSLTLVAAVVVSSPPAAASSPGASAVSAGDHTCALTLVGAADCWGRNTWGEATDQAGPYTQISANHFLTCALTPAGAVECWGDNTWGEATDQAGPYTQISAGAWHACALTPTRAADCWGYNDYGEATDQPGPYTQISAGAYHTCALTPAGAVECWGYNNNGEATNQPGPYTHIAAGAWHTCGLTHAGAVECWGDNSDGQGTDQTGPYTQISAAGQNTCGLTPTGAADCWGSNRFGQADYHAGPYTQVSAGDWHTCALTLAGAVDCWGWNAYGQLGGAPSISNTPADGTVGLSYSFAFASTPADVQTSYSLESGSPPPGLSLAANGQLTGTPTTQGDYPFEVRASSLFEPDNIKNFAIRIYPPPNTKPYLVLPGDQTAEATSAAGAAVTYSVSATDAEDGPPPTPICTSVSGSVFPIGTTTVNCNVTDSGGLTDSGSFTVTVNYAWTRFLQPVDNLPTVNTVKAGSAIPVKFSLGGNMGLAIFELPFPTSKDVACGSTADVDAVEVTVTAGSSSLNYDATTGTYTYVWKTEKAWANSCRTLTVKLIDGTVHQANFKFTK